MEENTNGSVTQEEIKKRTIQVAVFEFIEKTKFTALDGQNTFYFTMKDGHFLSDSLSHDKEKALAFFDNVVKHNGQIEVEKVLKSKTVKNPVENLN